MKRDSLSIVKERGDRLEVWDVSKRGSMESLGNIGRKGERIITKTRSSLNNNESMMSKKSSMKSIDAGAAAAGDISIIE